ncbi:exo-alpha-sialidase [Acuticoccus sp. M5D2P5]|uniref:WD40/YVTN/BNR-like repeat-containing protein n=1 Tax=Acuticoccus kalidii TaxID=2910977 RepID=UPI001F21EA1A|nr:sialidase family protein [Acuticoccus kalidii]MCF3932562.1 exo-alpha-sialidase [Acuticoccus kalidii]
MSVDGITVLVGTTKGAFLVSGGADRSGWTVSGPFCDGWPINHVVGDPATGRIWAGGGSDFHGAGIWSTSDGGQTWSLTRLTKGEMDGWAAGDAAFAAMIGWTDEPLPFGDAFSQIWSLSFADGTLYAGTKPAQLLKSEDGGASWTVNESLANHPSRETWNPGGAGLVLHTIVPHPRDPGTMWIGISAAGVFATEDGGTTWDRRNRLSNQGATAEHHHPAGPEGGEIGHCVHNMMRAAGNADRLYQQNHHGVWRSNDGGRSWDDISAGLPSMFGFPIRVHPRDPDTIWTIPLNGDMAGRFPPEAAAAVWRSRDGGATWEGFRDGLPQTACYFTVLRQAMAGDPLTPAGLYFGTNSGSIFMSADEGEHWDEIARHLPTVLSVEVLT